MAWGDEDRAGLTTELTLRLNTKEFEEQIAVIRHMFSMLGYALDNTLLELRKVEENHGD